MGSKKNRKKKKPKESQRRNVHHVFAFHVGFKPNNKALNLNNSSSLPLARETTSPL